MNNINNFILFPVTFFGSLAGQKNNTKIALIIAALAGFFTSGSSLIATRNIMPEGMTIIQFVFLFCLSGVLTTAMILALAWLPIKLFVGTKHRNLEIAGWTLVPQLIYGTILVIFAFAFPFYISSKDQANYGIEFITEAMVRDLPSSITIVGGYIFTAWNICLIYCAVIAFSNSKKRAMGAAVLSIIISLLLAYSKLLVKS